jgi:hypothetical protein
MCDLAQAWTELSCDPVFWCLLSAGTCTWLVLTIPVVFGLNRMYKVRFLTMDRCLEDSALEPYFRLWSPGAAFLAQRNGKPVPTDELRAAFRKKHQEKFWGRHWATAFAHVVLVALGLAALAWTTFCWFHGKDSKLAGTAACALAGGLMWVLADQVARMRRADYTASDAASHVLRLLLCVPMGLAMTSIMSDQAGPALAFLLGAFPTTTLFKYAQRLGDRRLKLGDTPAAQETFKLEALQGVGRSEAERFAEEGVRSLLRLAYSDPIELALRTNFELDYVVDCVSQALLWTYVSTNLKKVQALGLRGAVEAENLREALESGALQAAAMDDLKEIATALGVSVATVRRVLDRVNSHPHAEFMRNVWAMKSAPQLRRSESLSY